MESIENFLDYLEKIWQKITWRDVKLIGAGLSWGASFIMLWQYFDTMSGWPFVAIIFCAIMWTLIGWLLFESAME